VTADSDATPVALPVGAGHSDRDAQPVVLLVGAGPGHPDLLTLDAEAALRSAREVVADRSLAPLLEALAAEAELRAAEGLEGGPPGVHPELAAVDHAAFADGASARDQTDPVVSPRPVPPAADAVTGLVGPDIEEGAVRSARPLSVGRGDGDSALGRGFGADGMGVGWAPVGSVGLGVDGLDAGGGPVGPVGFGVAAFGARPAGLVGLGVAGGAVGSASAEPMVAVPAGAEGPWSDGRSAAVDSDGLGTGTEGAHGGGRPPVGGAVGAASVVWVDDDQRASADLLAAVGRGSGVVRLYRGDPWFHPAGDVERTALRTGGHRFDLVPGVVEELAVLAATGIPVQVRTVAVTTTFVVHDPLCSAGETEHSALPGAGRTAAAGSAGETEHSTLPGAGRTATAGAAERSGRSTSDGPGAAVEAPAVAMDAAHTLVVRTTDLAATARWLADGADPGGLVLDRPAAAVASGPGDHQPAEATRATLATLATRAPAQPGVVVVGLVAALDTTMLRVAVAGHQPRSACGTGRERSPGTSRSIETELGGLPCETGREPSPGADGIDGVALDDRSACETGRERSPGTMRTGALGSPCGNGLDPASDTSRTGEPCSGGSAPAVHGGSTEPRRSSGTDR